MSLSEHYRLAKGKQKSAHQSAATCSAHPHSPPGSDFAELVWENGQVMMQGQLNRATMPISYSTRLEDLPQNSRLKDKGLVKDYNTDVALGRLGMMESAMNDFHISVPSKLDEQDDMVPWLRYHIDEDEHVQHNYSSGFTGHNLLNDTNNVTPAGRRCDGVRAINDSHPTPEQHTASAGFHQRNVQPIRPKMSQVDQLSSHQSMHAFPSFGSKVSDIDSNCLNNSTQKLFHGDSAQKHYSSSVYPGLRMRTQDLGQQLSSSTIMNFSHFSKHACMVKSSLDTMSTKVGPEASVTKQMDGMEIGSVSTGAKPVDPSLVASISGQQRDSGFQSQLAVLSAVDGSKMAISKPHEMSLCDNHSGVVSCQDSKIINMASKQAVVPNGNTATGNLEKTAEPVVASSVCSGNSADRASNDPTYGLKRKYHEYEDSEYRSEDIEEESVGIRKATTNRVGSGSKRSRAAEVHNLSERRRRDRINEKMRALQELIPNCNKVDKASMLDEAIEYLKTLQLQVQMMSMGPGLCMPPMMLPHATHMPRFAPVSAGMGMGMGMGIGMGYGLGMLDMNANPSNYQLVQMPSVPGTRFPMAPAPVLGNMTANPLPNFPMYGFQGQGIGIPISCAPAISYAAGPPGRPVMDSNSINSVLTVGDLALAQTSLAKDMVQNELPKPDDIFSKGLITSQAANDVHLLPTSKAIEYSSEVDPLPVRETM